MSAGLNEWTALCAAAPLIAAAGYWWGYRFSKRNRAAGKFPDALHDDRSTK